MPTVGCGLEVRWAVARQKAAALDQGTRARGRPCQATTLILGRRRVRAAGGPEPRSWHALAPARWARDGIDRGAVIEQAVGLVQRNRGEMVCGSVVEAGIWVTEEGRQAPRYDGLPISHLRPETGLSRGDKAMF